MFDVLNTLIEDDIETINYTMDGVNIAYTVKRHVGDIDIVNTDAHVTPEEMQAQILLNTEYLVSRTELGLGGI